MRQQLGKQEREALTATLLERYGLAEAITKKDVVELVEENGEKRIFINGEAAYYYHDNAPIPLLRYLLKNQFLPAVVVDMGAVKFVTGGADVMRPGIKELPATAAQGTIVCVVDERHRKPLAVGTMLMDGATAQAAATGKIVKNLHWVGDKRWMS